MSRTGYDTAEIEHSAAQVYDVAASTPDIPIRPEELKENQAPRRETVVVRPSSS